MALLNYCHPQVENHCPRTNNCHHSPLPQANSKAQVLKIQAIHPFNVLEETQIRQVCLVTSRGRGFQDHVVASSHQTTVREQHLGLNGRN